VTKAPKNVVASVLARLRNVAQEAGLSFNDILQSYVIERFLSRLSRSPHADTVLQRRAASPKDIAFSCNCPDSAAMCKHVAATLYGIGARLDVEPELLFVLRKVDAKELIARAGEGGTPVQKLPDAGRILDSSKLADVFGIDFGGVDAKPFHRPTAKKAKSVAPRAAKSANRVGKRSARGKSGKAR